MRQFVAGIAMGALVLCHPVAGGAQSLGIGAGAQGSQNYAVNAGIAKFLENELSLDVRVQAFGGTGRSMPLIHTKRLDLQLISSPDVFSAVAGKDDFQNRPLNNLRVVASLSESTYGLMVRKDSKFRKVSEIAGRSITYGYTAQPATRSKIDAILAAAGLTPEKMQLHMVPSLPRGVDDFIAGSVDVAYFAMQSGKVREADASAGIRWLALDDTPESKAAIRKILPTGLIKVVQPRGNVGVDGPTPTLSFDYLMIIGAHVPDDLVYKITKALHQNKDKIRAIGKTFAEFTPDSMRPELPGLTYHPGATKFYREAATTR